MSKKAPPQDWTWFQKGEIDQALRACERLMKAGLLSGVYPAEVERASLTFLLINLNDLLQKMKSIGYCLEFAEDIHPVCNADNVTSLINNARNAACHLNSGNHLLNTNKISYCLVRGHMPGAFSINGVLLGCDYADDAAIIFGSNRLYYGRHVTRALNAAKAFFAVTDVQ